MAATTADELYENAACGLLTTDAEGMVQRVNRTLLDGMGLAGEEVERHRFDSLLTAAGRLFAETRFLPVLRLEGRGDELALELRRADGGTLPALVNAVGTGTDGPVPVAIFEAPQRRDYERELLQARRGAGSGGPAAARSGPGRACGCSRRRRPPSPTRARARRSPRRSPTLRAAPS